MYLIIELNVINVNKYYTDIHNVALGTITMVSHRSEISICVSMVTNSRSPRWCPYRMCYLAYVDWAIQ